MPTRRLGRSLTATEVCDQLDGLMTPHALLKRARRGLVPGAFKIGHRVYFSVNTALWLVQELSATSPAGYAITIPREGSANGYQAHPT